TYTLRLETGNPEGGYASVFIDLNRNDVWEPSERVMANISAAAVDVNVTLDSNPYRFRVDHSSHAGSPTLRMSISGSGTSGFKDIATYLTVPVEGSTPATPVLIGPADQATGIVSTPLLRWASDRADDYQ